ncbi:MAG: thioredoxin family protein [Bacteroidetes bacterium]|nr:thioredoxin family protein [Bacteroidota bacterium]
MKKNIILIFIICSFTISCTNHKSQSKILTDYLSCLLNKNYKENGKYLIVTPRGCLGCISSNLLYLKKNPLCLKQFLGIVYSNTIAEQFPDIKTLEISKYCDSTNKLDVLNIGVSGLAIVTLKKNEVVKIENSNVNISSQLNLLNNFYKKDSIFKTLNSLSFKELYRVEFENKFKDINFKELSSDKKMVLYFTSDYCAPCKLAFPIIDSLSVLYKDSIEFYYIKANKKDNSLIFNKYNIYATPTLIVLKKGKKLKKIIGCVKSDKISNFILN